jgi:hypothetical protein
MTLGILPEQKIFTQNRSAEKRIIGEFRVPSGDVPRVPDKHAALPRMRTRNAWIK